MSKLLNTLPENVQRGLAEFGEFIAEKNRKTGRRTDRGANLNRMSNPLEEMWGTSTVRFDSNKLRADALEFVQKAGLPDVFFRRAGRQDASFTAMFARQLEYFFTETFDAEYPELRGRQLIPVDTRVPSGADYYTYRQFDMATKASFLSEYAKNEFPESDVYGDEFKQAIKGIGSKYSYNVQDMRAAAMSGIPLDAKKAESARYGIEKKIEAVCAYGDVAAKLYGITNAPGIGQTTKISGPGTWAQLVAANLPTDIFVASQQILQDINTMSNQIYTQTLGIHKPTTLVLPTSVFGLLATTPFSPKFMDKSILKYLLEFSPWITEIVDWNYINTVGAYSLPGTFAVTNGSASVTASVNQTTSPYVYAGALLTFAGQPGVQYTVLSVSGTTVTLTSNYTGTTHTSPATTATQQSGLAVMYDKNPLVLQLIISQEFEQFAPQVDGLTWEVYCHERTGGVNVIRPLAVTTMAGIS